MNAYWHIKIVKIKVLVDFRPSRMGTSTESLEYEYSKMYLSASTTPVLYQ